MIVLHEDDEPWTDEPLPRHYDDDDPTDEPPPLPSESDRAGLPRGRHRATGFGRTV